MIKPILASSASVILGLLYIFWFRLQQIVRLSSAKKLKLNDVDHLNRAVDWLLTSHSMARLNGFSALFSLKLGWGKPYPETTGYIIPTLLNFSKQSSYRKEEIINACKKSGEWLLSIQHPDGSFSGYDTNEPIIFDTGQVLRGLCALYLIFKDARYLTSAVKAGDWLKLQQEQEGSWLKYTYNKIPRAYNALVDVSLLELASISGDSSYRDVAIKNLDWVISQQLPNGWYQNSSFKEEYKAVLHTIAYTLQGLIESGLQLNEDRYIKSAQQTADVLLAKNEKSILSGYYNYKWHAVGLSRCLTGLSQMSLVWYSLYKYTSDEKYLLAAKKTFSYLKLQHNSTVMDANLMGGLAGSDPIWGNYFPFAYPNWGVKFFIDLTLVLSDKKE